MSNCSILLQISESSTLGFIAVLGNHNQKTIVMLIASLKPSSIILLTVRFCADKSRRFSGSRNWWLHWPLGYRYLKTIRSYQFTITIVLSVIVKLIGLFAQISVLAYPQILFRTGLWRNPHRKPNHFCHNSILITLPLDYATIDSDAYLESEDPSRRDCDSCLVGSRGILGYDGSENHIYR